MFGVRTSPNAGVFASGERNAIVFVAIKSKGWNPQVVSWFSGPVWFSWQVQIRNNYINLLQLKLQLSEPRRTQRLIQEGSARFTFSINAFKNHGKRRIQCFNFLATAKSNLFLVPIVPIAQNTTKKVTELINKL